MIIKTRFTKKEHADSGLAFLLLTLLIGVWVNPEVGSEIALGEVLVLLIAPALFYPFTFIWLNFSELLGKVMSKVILSLIFMLFVCPVGIIRKMIGKDSLLLNQYGKDKRSVFKDRSGEGSKIDFKTPY